MINFKKILFVILILNASAVYSYVDLNLSYSLSKRRIEGTETPTNSEPGSAEITSEGATINWAWYIWKYTALEFNYGQTKENLKDNRRAITEDTSITILQVDSEVTTQIAGVGFRQSFNSRKASIQPSLSIGYAQYSTTGTTRYRIDNNGTEEKIEIVQDKNIFSSGYIAFAVKFKLTELMGLTVSAKTVMPEFDTSEAENNVTYAAGFSWIF